MTSIALDTAGAGMGGAARWLSEFDAFAATTHVTAQRTARPTAQPTAQPTARPPADPPVRVLGRGRRLGPVWLARREYQAAGCELVIATNNASFALAGADRRVLLRNALHFLYPQESDGLRGMPRSLRAQARAVRGLARRADLIIVPSSAMAERVAHHLPSVAGRIVVRAHPVTPAGPRLPADVAFILVPVLAAPYKRLETRLRELLEATAQVGRPWQIQVTARAEELPDEVARHPRITPLGMVGQAGMARLWRSAGAAYFPSTLESFGYPLAEARVYGVPVLAPDTPQAREIAGPALVGYHRAKTNGLAEAVARVDQPVIAQPAAFDRDGYFRWLFQPAQKTHHKPVLSANDDKSGRDTLLPS